MKKTIIFVVVVLSLLFIVACGNSNTNTDQHQNIDLEISTKQTSDATTENQTTEHVTTPQAETEIVMATETTQATTTQAEGIRPEFKAAMDDYEAFYDEYCIFMKKYKDNPTDFALLGQYTTMMSKALDMSKSFEAWEQDDMTTEELKYYLEVSARVAQKLVDVSN